MKKIAIALVLIVMGFGAAAYAASKPDTGTAKSEKPEKTEGKFVSKDEYITADNVKLIADTEYKIGHTYAGKEKFTNIQKWMMGGALEECFSGGRNTNTKVKIVKFSKYKGETYALFDSGGSRWGIRIDQAILDKEFLPQ